MVNGTHFAKTINVLVGEFVRIQADFQSSEFLRIQLRSEVSTIALTVAALKGNTLQITQLEFGGNPAPTIPRVAA